MAGTMAEGQLQQQQLWLRMALAEAQQAATSAKDLRVLRWMVLELSQQHQTTANHPNHDKGSRSYEEIADYEDLLADIGRAFGWGEKPTTTKAKLHLRQFGQPGCTLASRLGQLSKDRNRKAHPDATTRLLTDLHFFLARRREEHDEQVGEAQQPNKEQKDESDEPEQESTADRSEINSDGACAASLTSRLPEVHGVEKHDLGTTTSQDIVTKLQGQIDQLQMELVACTAAQQAARQQQQELHQLEIDKLQMELASSIAGQCEGKDKGEPGLGEAVPQGEKKEEEETTIEAEVVDGDAPRGMGKQVAEATRTERVDPSDGSVYIWEEQLSFYRRETLYQDKEIAAYWETCKPI